jgi:predicted ATPase/DNA-binding CsgD family transcriptional regulator
VRFADLAPFTDPDLVAPTVADALGVVPEPGQPALAALAEAAGRLSVLLVLDNCEHVIGAAAKLADALLRGSPNVVLLATSREPLGIDGERMYRVPSLTVPPEDAEVAAIWGSEAVRLLTDRVAAQGASLGADEESARIAARICRRLDGMPLAIELAAARLRVVPAAELESRLDERFSLLTGGSRVALPRHQTLRAMVGWSWELLNPAERLVLARLSVFAGGFDLAAASAVVASSQVPAAEVAPVLGALVDKSLVQFGDTGAGPGRYRLLDTVRQYAAEQLDTRGSVAVSVAHRDHYLALAEQAASGLRGDAERVWLDRLDAELGNLRVALAFSATQPDLDPGLRMVAALPPYWSARCHAAEGAGALRALLDAPGAELASLSRARALAGAAHLLTQLGGDADLTDYYREALDIARAAGEESLVADVQRRQAILLLRRGQADGVLPLIEEGLGIAQRLGDPYLIASLVDSRAFASYASGDLAGAIEDVGEALRLYRVAGSEMQTGQMLSNLGYLELSVGDLDAARSHQTSAIAITRTFNDPSGLANQINDLGLTEYLSGEPVAAEALFAEALDLARRVGTKRGVAYSLVGLALAAHGRNEPERAARLHGAAAQTVTDLAQTLAPLETRLADEDGQRLRAELGDKRFETEYATGRALDPGQVLDELGHRDAAPGSLLTPRELDVLRLVAQGLSNPDIARRLVLSEHTVHRHLANILGKLSLSSRTAAAAWGTRAGLV